MRKGWYRLVPALAVAGFALTACSGGPAAPKASARSATSPSTGAGSSTTSTPSSTSTTAPPPTPTTSTAVLTGRPPGPGVLATCTDAPPQALQVEPTSIVVACADGGIGAQDLTWSTWTSTEASGSGEIWQNDCTPDCAGGTFKYYPASITLSDVRPSPDGPAFTVLTASYGGAEPNGRPVDTFQLELPQG